MTTAAEPAPDVLIVEDEAITALDLATELSGMGYHVCGVVDTAEAAVGAAVTARPAVVLMDIRLANGGDGIETAQRICGCHDTAIVFLTAHSDEATLARALAVSPFGYLIKPFRARDLKVAIDVALTKHSRDSAAVQRLRALAATDGLTGLANRRQLDDTLRDEWLRGLAAGSSLAVVMIDIDRFKAFNDAAGHLAGDACLAQVAERVQAACEGREVVLGRWGGEEFLAVMRDTSLEDAMTLADCIVDAVQRAALPHAAGRPGDIVTVSAGAAAAVPTADSSVAVLVGRADRGLYSAKRAGRARASTAPAAAEAEAIAGPTGSPVAPRLLPLTSERAATMGERLGSLHRQIAAEVPEVDQIACVLHDPDTGMLKTFVDSSHAGEPLRRYEFPLAASRSLSELVRLKSCRIVNDIPAELPGAAPHTAHIRGVGFRSSYTVPLFDGDVFQGFLFLDSRQPAAFSPAVVQRLEVHINLARMLFCHELTGVRSLVGAIRVARGFSLLHDVEVTRHLDRMAHYARLIARHLAIPHGLSDEFVEQVFLFAPLHDIGKAAIPEAILHKPKALTAEERTVMATHVELGVELIERLIRQFNLGHLAGIRTLRNIVAGHHEFLDGSGYPRGLRGGDIPLEARIVTVADIFDALCSRRHYKVAWGMDEAFALLDSMVAEGKLDGQCVGALAGNRPSIRTIMDRYAGGPDGGMEPSP